MNATMKYKREKEVHDYIDSIWNDLSQHAKDVICGTVRRNDSRTDQWPGDEE